MSSSEATATRGGFLHDDAQISVTLTPEQAAVLADELVFDFGLEQWTAPIDRDDLAEIRKGMEVHERDLVTLRHGEEFSEPVVFTSTAERVKDLSQTLYERGGERLSCVGFAGRSENDDKPEDVASDRRQGHGMIDTASVLYEALVAAGQVPA